jgi:nucleoside-diphosphate-sugar epimerase
VSERRALLTGAGGFVGACLARRLLADGWHAELLVRPGSDRWRLQDVRGDAAIREVDLRDAAAVTRAVEQADAEWIFHLAAHGAYSWQTDPRGIVETNLLGTLNVVEAAVARGFASFVHAGSSSEYGFKDHAPGEDEAPEPNSHYAVAKVAATLLCRYTASAHDLHLATLRLSSVYGQWEDPRRLVPTLIARGLAGELPSLVDPDTARDFIHVEDVCDAFMAVAQRPVAGSSGIYNVGSGRQSTLREIVEVARTTLGIAAEPEWGSHPPRRWDTQVWISDPGKIEREVGWRAQRDLARGFAETAAWLRDRPDLWPRYGAGA